MQVLLLTYCACPHTWKQDIYDFQFDCLNNKKQSLSFFYKKKKRKHVHNLKRSLILRKYNILWINFIGIIFGTFIMHSNYRALGLVINSKKKKKTLHYQFAVVMMFYCFIRTDLMFSYEIYFPPSNSLTLLYFDRIYPSLE